MEFSDDNQSGSEKKKAHPGTGSPGDFGIWKKEGICRRTFEKIYTTIGVINPTNL